MWCVYLIAALNVAVYGPLWLGILLGLPALLYAVILAGSIFQGVPTTSRSLNRLLVDTLIDVGGEDVFAVVVQDQAPFPIALRRRRQRPVVIAAIDFLTGASDEILRGVAALQHAEFRDPQMTRLSHIGRALPLITGAGVAAGAWVFTTGTQQLAAIIASVALSTWLSAVLRNAMLRPGAAQRLHHSDLAAAALLGSHAPVVEALQAAASWRARYQENLSRLDKFLLRCIQPIAPHFNESQRALNLNDASSPRR